MELKEELSEIIKDLRGGVLHKRVVSFKDYKTKYIFPKERVVVTVELKNGLTADIDVTDYFFKGE